MERVEVSVLAPTRPIQPRLKPGPRGRDLGAARAVTPIEPAESRPRAQGKFLFADGRKLYIRGATYGAFRPDVNGNEYHDLKVVEQDFAQMAANGLNAVRIPHTTPPRGLLDVAQRHGLRVMVGLSAEQHVGSLIDNKGSAEIERLVRARVKGCAGHPALLCYALGNEIPAALVRWLGTRRVEQYLARLYETVKEEDPQGLVTYVNYPSTEYLELPDLDLVGFNVYLEARDRLESYLARLQNLAGERPLFMTELGLDALRHGQAAQAQVLDWQIRTAFGAGCAGVFVFSWTDEWYREGADVEDWAFGLVGRDRQPKPALAAVRKAFAEAPFPARRNWPRISVVVCTHNGARTIRDCLEGLRELDYPDFEVIVIDDGSSDSSAAIAREYACRLISTENRGLSSARNAGLQAATGEIVAYIDDDAYPDQHWLSYLADTFLTSKHGAVGGPNLAPPSDGPIAECVASAPGGPAHVLLSDQEAEHIPGCNMAFRKSCLQAIGGFDPQFRVAGDDVDVCWRLQKQGLTLGFNPAAVVWHHRRNSVRAYWRQQAGYGKAEALLEAKWPEKYNDAGHAAWAGRLYGRGLAQALSWGRGRIYYGIWGTAPFQSLYQPASNTLASFFVMPECYLLIFALTALSALGMLWSPLLLAVPLLVAAVAGLFVHAYLATARVRFASVPRSASAQLKLRAVTASLHLLQPLARLYGRLRQELAAKRWNPSHFALPMRQRVSAWSRARRSTEGRIHDLETALRAGGALVRRGGDYDRWDLEVRAGRLGASRVLMASEDCGGGQLFRVRWWPRCSPAGLVPALLFALLSMDAALNHARAAAGLLGGITLWLTLRLLLECGSAMARVRRALEQQGLSKGG